MIVKIIRNICLALASMALASACGDDEHFRVNGSIDGNPTMNLRVSWYADGNWHQLITAAREGAFEFAGAAPQGAVLEINDYENRLLGRTFVANGQELELHLDRANPWNIQASGNEVASAWADFLRSNADIANTGSHAVNSAIARYIGENPENMVSTLLLTANYDAAADLAGADSLLQLIATPARPAWLTESFNFMLQRMVQAGASEPVVPFRYLDRRDSLLMLRPADAPYTLLAFDNNRSGRADSIVPVLKQLKSDHRRLGILEISLDSDSAEWKRNTRRDTATWSQGWGAEGFAARGVAHLGIPGVPFFIVCDSAGNQLLRTASITAAADSINSLMRP